MRRIIYLTAGGLAIFALSAPLRAPAAPPAAEATFSLEQAPPPAQHPQDPGDSLYRAARAALTRGDYTRAAQLFRTLADRHPRSSYTPDALYWEAFARYRQGGTDNLRAALARLEAQAQRFPRAATAGDARSLSTRIRGTLAREGDAGAAEAVTQAAAAAARPAPRAAAGPCPTGEDDVRTAALNALLQMNAERALPVLKQVLARRDACAAPLRERAVFLVSQQRTAETEEILLSVARDDPSAEVREKAVFWLSQVPTARAVEILEDILRTSRDAGMREKAIFALAQHGSPRGAQILRAVVEQPAYGADLREKAIFWIGQEGGAEDAAYLRALYGRLDSAELREKVLFSLSQMEGQGNDRWLLGVATSAREPLELRKKALFWLGQTDGLNAAQVAELYDRMTEREMREQAIFVLSQSDEAAAVDKLISIARAERDAELRKKAIFWLGQSDDPRVAQILAELAGGE